MNLASRQRSIGRERRACFSGGAEGATAPETLRQKDRSDHSTLKSCRKSSTGTPQEQAFLSQERESLRYRTEGAYVAHGAHVPSALDQFGAAHETQCSPRRCYRRRHDPCASAPDGVLAAPFSNRFGVRQECCSIPPGIFFLIAALRGNRSDIAVKFVRSNSRSVNTCSSRQK